MYNYVPNLSPKNIDNSDEETPGFGSHSRFSYSLSSANNSSHNNSHNSLHSLSSQNFVTVSDRLVEPDNLIRAKDQVLTFSMSFLRSAHHLLLLNFNLLLVALLQ